MNDSSQAWSADSLLRRWRIIAIACAVVATISTSLFAATIYFATQTIGTHYNLYYLLWKAGLRSYEQPIAFGGLFHDSGYRQRFIGMSVEEIQQAFPNTFYKLRKAPPIAKPNQEFYIDDYRQAQQEDGRFAFCWVAIFEAGRLIELDVFKP